MPKLGLNADTNEMRRHILRLQENNLIDITEYVDVDTGKLNFASRFIVNWDETNVRKYYMNVIPDEAFDKLDEIEAKEKADYEYRMRKDAEHKASRPTDKDPDYIKRREDILMMNLDEEEEKASLADLEEELEYRQLKHDADGGAISDEGYIRLAELDEKYNIEEYTKFETKAEKLQKQADEKNAEVEEFREKYNPKEPNAFIKYIDKALNKVFGVRIESVVINEKYKALREERQKLEFRVQAAKDESNRIQEENKEFNYADNAKKRDDNTFKHEARIFNQAKNIAIKENIARAKEKGVEVKELTKAELFSRARVIVASKEFKEVAEELHAGDQDVSFDTFHVAYRNKMQAKYKPEPVVENKGENLNKHIENEQKVNEQQNPSIGARL